MFIEEMENIGCEIGTLFALAEREDTEKPISKPRGLEVGSNPGLWGGRMKLVSMRTLYALAGGGRMSVGVGECGMRRAQGVRGG